MLALEELAAKIRPDRTILLLGAGAAVSSGAPTGAALARSLAKRINPSPDGDDLMEISGIFENRFGRKALAEEVRKAVSDLEPAGALISLAGFGWRSLYTTNFDQLIEKAYKRAGVDYSLVRSNYDFSITDPAAANTKIYKIHGCITQDIADGHRSRMLLTERDYDSLSEYRESLFRSLRFEMTTTDTLIIGSSLRDLHLRDFAKEVAKLHSTSGVVGQIYMLVYDRDPDRAQLLEQKGIQVAFGDLESLVYSLTSSTPSTRVVFSTVSTGPGQLPPDLSAITMDVSHAVGWTADAVRLYNGSAATYGDIESGLTIPRAAEGEFTSAQNSAKGLVLVLTGVAGVGKTSLARRIVHKRFKEGAYCWEHLESFPVHVDGWLAVEDSLRNAGKTGYLLIDDCVDQLGPLNKLVDALGALDESHLKLVLTANASQWQVRTKSPVFFSHGTVGVLSRLKDADIEQLVNLVEREPQIQNLVEQQFAILTRQQRIKRLRDRCSSEMYVCLKNIFGSELLDDILLREYAELKPEEQEIYRHVAVLQAMGSKVHRQLIIRLLGIDAGTLQAMLNLLDGIVSEYDIKPSLGIYGWAARHDVIAEVIARYKFATPDELFGLLKRLVGGLNPSVWLEVETARAICATDWGISRLPEPDKQIELYKDLITVLPGERIPRRRLIRKFLDLGQLEDANRVIQTATEEIGRDSVIDRYRVYLAAQRAEKTVGILEADRVAMLHSARSLALSCVSNSPRDRQNYRALAEVSRELARRTQDFAALDDAIDRMKEAEQVILDPEMARDRRGFEQARRTLQAARMAF
ncbi:SIR2 family protein [Micromonospora zamorensis]|uniref:SIR2 family protein n=1 Tax=Micromonospora zamorensis TaxID=709883 RepID=UPI0033AA6497